MSHDHPIHEPEDDDNPYRPPHAALSPLHAAAPLPWEDRTPTGSRIRVGPRRLFKGRRLLACYLVALTAFLSHLGAIAAAVVWQLVFFGAPGLLVLTVIIAGLTLALAFPIYEGWNPLLLRPFWRRNADRRTEFVVELQLLPRLPRHGCERLDTADDIGRWMFTPGSVEYHGDCIDLSLQRQDVQAAGRVGLLRDGSSLFIPNTRLTLATPLLSRSALRVGVREGCIGPLNWLRCRQFQTALQAWMAAAPTAPPTPTSTGSA